MSNVINFLERMGQDAQLRHASRNEMELALAGTQIDPELQAAILAGNQLQLEALLGQSTICCMQMPGKHDEDDETEESPSREGEESAMRSASCAVASAG